jgi:S-adenosyl-L-methionine hydrolase (adenosine-forming)
MITLASDFGTPYPAAMKGVLSRRTDTRLVDVGHDFPRYDVRTAAFWLREVLPYFPPATHLVVVDPGVGTDRNAIVVRAGEHLLVGPDNGVLRPPARRLADGADFECYTIDEAAVDPPEPTGFGHDSSARASRTSTTFHGRDIFAPVAAAVHDIDPEDVGSLEPLTPTDETVDLVLPEATVDGAGERADGEVLVVDDFGNVITNVPGTWLEDQDAILANGERVPVAPTFDAVGCGERLATVGSHGYVELDVNRSRGDDAFALDVEDRVVFECEPARTQ